jgi:polar amino acid transport system permease protein
MSLLFFTKNFPYVTERHRLALDAAKGVVAVAAVAWLAVKGTQAIGYHWQWYRLPRFIASVDESGLTPGPLIYGLGITLMICAIGLVLAMAFGLVAALFRLSESFLARATARVYLETIRNTPLLVQLFFIYFVLGPILDIDNFTAAVLALSLFEGAYISEIIRAGIVSIHRSQWDAAYTLGLSGFQTYRHVILPQAAKRILPSLTGQSVSLIKDSALVSTIAVYDLTMRAQEIIAETYLAFEVWFTIAAMYLVLTVTLSLAAGRMEGRLWADVNPGTS